MTFFFLMAIYKGFSALRVYFGVLFGLPNLGIIFLFNDIYLAWLFG